MSGTGQFGTGQEFIRVATAAGVEYLLALRSPMIPRTALDATTQITTVGDNQRRSDLRTPQVIWTDQTGGMGEFKYEELDGIVTFTDSQLDTRHTTALSLPPQRTQLGGTISLPATPIFVESIATTSPQIVTWGQNASGTTFYSYDSGTLAWTADATLTFLTGFCRYNGKYIFTRANSTPTNGIAHSTTGAAAGWTLVAYNKNIRGCCVHDNKFYIYNETDSVLQWNADPTSTTYTSSTALKALPGETVYQLFEWRDRVGRAAIYVLTNLRLLQYDEDADQFLNFDDTWQGNVVNTALRPRATVWGRTGDLYLCWYNGIDGSMQASAMHYSGNRELVGPNQRGGMLAASRVRLSHLVGTQQWLWAFARGAFGTTNTGRTMALNGAGGWHTIFSDSSVGEVFGGGAARGLVWTVTNNSGTGTVWEQAAPDTPEQPLMAASGERTYWANQSLTHEYGFTDGGTDNMTKLALWVAVVCRDGSSAFKTRGLPANTSVVVEYLRDEDSGWTTLGTISGPQGATAFPNNLSFASGAGLLFKQIKLRLTLSTSSSSATPFVESVALAYVRQPMVRYAYQAVVDLSTARWGNTGQPGWNNMTAPQLRDLILGWAQPSTLLTLRFGGASAATALAGTTPPGGVTVPGVAVTVGGQDDATSGTGSMSLTFVDYSTPANG